MIKKQVFLVLLMGLISVNSFGAFGSNKSNHMKKLLAVIERMEKQQTAMKLEDVRQTLEAIEQTQKQVEMVQNDITNLESWGGLVLGEENNHILQTFEELNSINKSTQSILRNSKNIESNFDKIYLTKDKIASMDSKELAQEAYRITKYKNSNLKEHLKTASVILEQNEKDARKMSSFMATTDGATGNLQASLATKKGVDQLNTKIARLTDVQAKSIIIQTEKLAEEEAVEQLLDEQAKRITEMNSLNKSKVKSMRNKKSMW